MPPTKTSAERHDEALFRYSQTRCLRWWTRETALAGCWVSRGYIRCAASPDGRYLLGMCSATRLPAAFRLGLCSRTCCGRPWPRAGGDPGVLPSRIGGRRRRAAGGALPALAALAAAHAGCGRRRLEGGDHRYAAPARPTLTRDVTSSRRHPAHPAQPLCRSGLPLADEAVF
jgi:hypothetical protein